HRYFGAAGMSAPSPPQSALMPANLITLAHFSVSAAMSLPQSVGESASGVPPKSASRALSLESARPALISLLSFSTISAGVDFGAAMPAQQLASEPGTSFMVSYVSPVKCERRYPDVQRSEPSQPCDTEARHAAYRKSRGQTS